MPDRRPAAALFLAAALAAGGAHAADDGEFELVGQATYRFGPLSIYDAALFAPGGDFMWERPFALTLTYHHDIRAERIINASFDQMAHITGEDEENFEPLRDDLAACIPDVQDGDRITGVSAGANEATFYLNGEKTCELSAPAFDRIFFGIWLSENSSSPGFTRKLLGEAE